LLVLFLSQFTVFVTYSQNKITGKVYTNSDSIEESVPFANIWLFDIKDTTQIKTATVSDLAGNYELDKIPNGYYSINVSCIGFKPFSEKIKVGGTDILGLNIELPNVINKLEGVDIIATRIQRSIDKVTYIVTDEDSKTTRNSLDLLNIIPSINIDNVNNTISSTGGKQIKLLLNGMNASERELIALCSEDIAKIEHYNMPPARFASYSAVVNVITKITEDGGIVGANIQHAVTTGFGNDMFYFKYFKGRSQISVSYSLNYRDYKKRQVEENYNYIFDDSLYQLHILNCGKLGYQNNFFDLNFVNHNEGDYTVQFKLSPNFKSNNTSTNTEVTRVINELTSFGKGYRKTNGKQFNPIIDGYYYKKVTEKSELIFNIVGTGYFSTDSLKNVQADESGDTLLFDYMQSSTDKLSFIGEVVYSFKLNNSSIDFGYRYNQHYAENKVINSFENPIYRTEGISNYLYSELKGKLGKFSYRGSVGLTNSKFEENFNGNKYNRWIFRPLAQLGYSINESTGLKLYYISDITEPSLAELSYNRVFITENVVQQGNPNLNPFRGHVTGIAYYLYSKKLNLELDAVYGYTNDYINTYFIYKPDYIALTSLNGNKASAYGLNYGCTLKPLQWLNLKVNGSARYENIFNPTIGNSSHFSFPATGNISVVIKKMFILSYQHTIVTKTLDGPYLISNENYSNLGLSFGGKPIYAAINVFWPFTHAKYAKETVPESIVQYQSKTKILDNASMITFSVGYNFEFGEKLKEKKRLLNNEDKDSGVFLK